MNEKLLKGLNAQINKELNSFYIYLGMSAYFEEAGYPGAASWMKLQADEEMMHAMKFYHYVIDRGAQIELDVLDKPAVQYDSIKAAFEVALGHEKFITKSIDEVYSLAVEAKDNATVTFLQWFVTEQVEEEKNATDVLTQLKMVGDNPAAIFMVDQKLAQRVASPVPTA